MLLVNLSLRCFNSHFSHQIHPFSTLRLSVMCLRPQADEKIKKKPHKVQKPFQQYGLSLQKQETQSCSQKVVNVNWRNAGLKNRGCFFHPASSAALSLPASDARLPVAGVSVASDNETGTQGIDYSQSEQQLRASAAESFAEDQPPGTEPETEPERSLSTRGWEGSGAHDWCTTVDKRSARPLKANSSVLKLFLLLTPQFWVNCSFKASATLAWITSDLSFYRSFPGRVWKPWDRCQMKTNAAQRRRPAWARHQE